MSWSWDLLNLVLSGLGKYDRVMKTYTLLNSSIIFMGKLSFRRSQIFTKQSSLDVKN